MKKRALLLGKKQVESELIIQWFEHNCDQCVKSATNNGYCEFEQVLISAYAEDCVVDETVAQRLCEACEKRRHNVRSAI